MLFGTSKDVNLGPAAVMSLLTAEFGHSMLEDDATYAIALAFICGIIQIIMGLVRIGKLLNACSTVFTCYLLLKWFLFPCCIQLL